MALSPKRVIHRKVQRGRQHSFDIRENNIDFFIVLIALIDYFFTTFIVLLLMSMVI